MANQFTQAEAEGKPKPKGANQFTAGKRLVHDTETRDKMRAEHAAQKLQAILDDKDSTKDQIIAACKALMPYGKSTYASVLERRVEEPADEQETMARLVHLFTANPGLLKPLIEADPGLRAALKAMIDGKPTGVEQVTHSATG